LRSDPDGACRPDPARGAGPAGRLGDAGRVVWSVTRRAEGARVAFGAAGEMWEAALNPRRIRMVLGDMISDAR